MKKLFKYAFILSFALSSCYKPQNGNYLVYRTNVITNLDNMGERLNLKFKDNQYFLQFSKKFVKVTKSGTNDFVVLAKQENDAKGVQTYYGHMVVGNDSVSLDYQLKADPKNIVLNISANRKGFKSLLIPYEASVDYYLATVPK